MNWKLLKTKWDTFLLIVAVTAAVFTFLDMKASAEDAQHQIKQLAEIARDLRDPNLFLRNWLLLNGVDSTQARIWSTMQKGPVPDSTGTPLPGIPFLDPKEMPERGVLMILTSADSAAVVLDTLWAFVKTKKK